MVPTIDRIEEVDSVIVPMLGAARVPGAAVAIVAGGEIVYAKGYGLRDIGANLPMTPETSYPIASATKAINATLLGILVDDGKLRWDVPVQTFLPDFRFMDPVVSSQITLRDLLSMRTGLPRHDWLWIENPISRAEVVERLRYLECSSGFRERFQYNNLTVTAAGHIAEVVSGQSWEDLVTERILDPISMNKTSFGLPEGDIATASYHETGARELTPTRRLATEVTAPSGGSMQSSVVDMARWLLFNLNHGKVNGRALISPAALQEIYSPQVLSGGDGGSPSAKATYAMGWFVDSYNGRTRISHPGYIHDVNSDVALFPEQQIGIISFTNFGCNAVARLINEHIFDWLLCLKPINTLVEKLEQYENKIRIMRERDSTLRRVEGTNPSHPLNDYIGNYSHPGYGLILINREGEGLEFQRHVLRLSLEHWHYDAWISRDISMFYIHAPHPFDRASRFLFETNADGQISAVSIRLEPAVAPIRFVKERHLR
jgi:CubicO group peptidase (beta-lactamase class C family)